MARRDVRLPSPRVRFGPGFLARLGRSTLRLAMARERREGAGAARLFGVGAEFVGHRPYRPGEEIRQLDWSLYARLGKPYLRVARREASERWAVILDTSASMGVGQVGKLQAAAELVAGIAASGVHQGAQIAVWSSTGPRHFRLRRRQDLAALLGFLAEESAAGERGLAALVNEPARFQGAGRMFLVSDFLDIEPKDLGPLVRRGRELFCAAVLAREELTPPQDASVEWVHPERGARLSGWIDARATARYEAKLARHQERWKRFALAHRARYHQSSSETPFEETVDALFGA